MKKLNVNKETMVRLQDADMANLVGARSIFASNTTSNKSEATDKDIVIEIVNNNEETSSSCCQKSCK